MSLRDFVEQLVVMLTAAGLAAAVAFLIGRLGGVYRPVTDRSGWRAVVLLSAAMACYVAIFIYFANRKFDAFGTAAVDFSIHHQMMWAGGRGAFLYQTIILTKPHINHVALFTQLISPITLLTSSPRLLLVIQPLALAAAAVPAFLIARRFTPSRYLALAFGVSLLLSVPFQSITLYDFHERVFLPVLILWAWWFVERGRYRGAVLFFFLALLVLEEAALYVACAGAVIALGLRRLKLGWALAAGAGAHFLCATYFVYPQLTYLGGGASNPILNAFGVASSPFGLLLYIIRHPVEWLARAADFARARYLLQVWSPWAFLPLAAGWGWLTYATPTFYALFSSVPAHYDITYQYVIPFVPFLFYFGVRAWGGVERQLARKPVLATWARRALTAYLVFVGLGNSYAFGPLGRRYEQEDYEPTAAERRFRHVASLVSPDRSLAASMYLLPHVQPRWHLWLLPHQFHRHARLLPYEVLMSVGDLEEGWLAEDWLIPARWEMDRGWRRYFLIELLKDRRYGCIYADKDYVLLRRGAKGVYDPKEVFESLFNNLDESETFNEVGVRISAPDAGGESVLWCPAEQQHLGVMARCRRYWPPGVVRVNCYLRAENPKNAFGPVADLVVARVEPTGKRVVAVRTIYASEIMGGDGYVAVANAFVCEGRAPYEFRLYGRGNADLYFDRFYVEAPTLELPLAFNQKLSPAERKYISDKTELLRREIFEPPPGYHLPEEVRP